jgi:hypothetical protein
VMLRKQDVRDSSRATLEIAIELYVLVRVIQATPGLKLQKRVRAMCCQIMEKVGSKMG